MTTLPSNPTDPASLPMTQFSEPWLGALRRAMGSMNGKPILMGAFSLNRDQKREVERRLSNFRRKMLPAPNDHQLIALQLALLLKGAYRVAGETDSTAELRAQAYYQAIGNVPGWAVREAVSRVISGRVPSLNKSFCPSPAEFADIVAEVMQPWRKELADLIGLASIEAKFEPSAEERARVNHGFEALRRELGGKPKGGDPTSAAVACAKLQVRAVQLGVDPSAIDALPDAPPRDGDFRKL